jgi:hypothetical protein
MPMHRWRAHQIAALGALLALPLTAQLDETCMVSAFNRTAPVQTDGVWVLPNVPANQGSVRVRATCVAWIDVCRRPARQRLSGMLYPPRSLLAKSRD